MCVSHPCGAMEARWTSNSKVVGSNPIRGGTVFFFLPKSLIETQIILCCYYFCLYFSWRTPTSVKHRSFKNLRSSINTSSQPISPLVYSSPSSSSVRHNHSLSTSSPASNHPITTTPNRQQAMTPGRYFDFRYASPQTRGVVGYRGSGGGGGNTTPQRSGPQMQPRSVSHFRAPL